MSVVLFGFLIENIEFLLNARYLGTSHLFNMDDLHLFRIFGSIYRLFC